MKIFFTADDHFGHQGILKHTDRGTHFSSIQHHDDYLIRRWNTTVKKHDVIYILGDFAWTNHNKYIAALNGKKILIIGSHDKMSQMSKRNFTEIHNGMLVRTIEKQPFVLTHCAMRVWERSHYGAINLHGHSHGRLSESEYLKQMDVGVDVAFDYTPFSLEFILYKMSLKLPFDAQYNGDKLTEENRMNNCKLMDQMRKSK